MGVTRQPPTWGARGQGWVAAQFALLGLALVIGVLDLSGWPDSLRDGLRYVGVLLISGGVVIAVYAVLGLGSSLTAAPAPVEHGQLRTDGIYGVVRHPIYSALGPGLDPVVAAGPRGTCRGAGSQTSGRGRIPRAPVRRLRPLSRASAVGLRPLGALNVPRCSDGKNCCSLSN